MQEESQSIAKALVQISKFSLEAFWTKCCKDTELKKLNPIMCKQRKEDANEYIHLRGSMIWFCHPIATFNFIIEGRVNHHARVWGPT